ncbi:hypothetical protein [Rubrivivax gelatinosus]|uniref:Uncharacterized protein n=1 Tax=Rubrivivax gelatinosus (strain NBRC 100245 / IL144) TaxID=983917 RepID=I0HV26_RUBGI|nr:hypothetical protein [Rubrivivax gelatinosus]MBG6078796.1 hypothetical protein [Rubrivivax gelatinosus]BAL96863.1 hypothetical protein RGE_35240 [Rubrivivax gelatinosus IL144]
MCALRITDPFDPEPAAPPVPQLAWPQRHAPAAESSRAENPAGAAEPHGDRSWRRYARPAPQRA